MPHIRNEGADIWFEVEGSGEPVLFIQGVGVVGNGWRPQVEGLRGRYRVAVFDNRGIGRSGWEGGLSIAAMAGDARAVMDAAGWESCHVVGHSMGGVIAQELALEHPGRVRSLMLMCTVARGADAVRMSARMCWVAVRMRIGSRASRRRAFMGLIYPREFLEGARADALAEELAPLFGHDLAEQPRIAMKQAMALRRWDRRSELGGVGSRTLVVSAEHDPIAPVRSGRELAGLIPGAEFEVVRGASHGVTIHKAGEVNERISRWVG